MIPLTARQAFAAHERNADRRREAGRPLSHFGGKTGAAHPRSHAIVTPEGRFASARLAAEHYDVTPAGAATSLAKQRGVRSMPNGSSDNRSVPESDALLLALCEQFSTVWNWPIHLAKLPNDERPSSIDGVFAECKALRATIAAIQPRTIPGLRAQAAVWISDCPSGDTDKDELAFTVISSLIVLLGDAS